MELDEPQAYIDVLPYVDEPSNHEQSDCLDDGIDESDDGGTVDRLFGFPPNDSTFMLNVNRMIDLGMYNRYRSPKDYNWNQERSVTPIRKRNYPSGIMFSVATDGFTPVKTAKITPKSVPTRGGRQKPTQF